MKYISSILHALLIATPVAVGIRVIICQILMVTDPENEQVYKTRRRNAIWFFIITEHALTTLLAIYSYFTIKP